MVTDKPEMSTFTPLRVSEKSPMSTKLTSSEKLMVTTPTAALRGSGEMSVMSAVGATVSAVQESVTLPASALPMLSTMLEPAAVRVSRKVPVPVVMPAVLPSVQVMLSLVVRVCDPVMRLAPPLSVSERSARSKPVTASLKVMVKELTVLLRGSGVTSVMSAVGTEVSTVTESAEEATD